MENVYSYADVLESYMIAEEGFGDAIKKAGKFVGKALYAVIRFIREGLKKIVEKVRSILSSKNKGKRESKKDAITRLEKENDEKVNKIKMLEDALRGKDSELSKKSEEVELIKSTNEFISKHNYRLSDRNEKLSEKKEKATQLIAKLKKEIVANKEKIKEIESSARDSRDYDDFQSTAIKFTALVTNMIVQGYAKIPGFINEARKLKVEEMDRDGQLDFIEKIDDAIPDMHTGQWSYFYKMLKFSYLPKVKENGKYLAFGSDLGRALGALVKQGNDVISYIEKIIKENESSNNKAVNKILSFLNGREGYFDMLKSSITLSNEILACFTTHDLTRGLSLSLRHNGVSD